MKTKDLLPILNKIKKIKMCKTLVSLENILNNNGTLTFSNLEVTYTAKIGFEGKFLIDFKQLEKIISRIPRESEIKVCHNGEYVNLVVIDGGIFTIPSADVNDFPRNPEADEPVGKLSDSDIAIIKKAVKFSGDNYGIRPIMNCVHLGTKHIVASDSTKLCYFNYGNGINKSINITNSCVPLLEENDYDVYVKGLYVKLENENEVIVIKNPDAIYPNYEAVIPLNNYNIYEVVTKKLSSTIKLAEISSNTTSKLIRFKFDGNDLTIKSNDLDSGTSFEEKITCKPTEKSEPIEIGFKADYILDILAFCGESTVIKMNLPSMSVLFNDDLLLMPMIIS